MRPAWSRPAGGSPEPESHGPPHEETGAED
jgi:hypothetical protein